MLLLRAFLLLYVYTARANTGEDMVHACVHLVQHTYKQTRDALLCARLYS